jgi:hypothetical protein
MGRTGKLRSDGQDQPRDSDTQRVCDAGVAGAETRVAIRAEQFHDPDNGISGTPQTLREATLTYEMRPHEHLILKLETRYDRSTAAVFADDERDQFLALVGAVVTF